MKWKSSFRLSEFTNPSGEIVFRVSGWLGGKRIRRNFPTRVEANAERQILELRREQGDAAVRVTSAFAELTGDATREVFLDEHLQIAGIGRTRDSAYTFDQLSQGAKEQLLLCLRLAVAQELSADEPQVLILDDVLVNTDPVRQERILDVLGAQTARMQILILTCHPDRYRGMSGQLSLSNWK